MPSDPSLGYSLLCSDLKSASEVLPTQDAAKRLDEVWSQVDELAGLAESRMRILIARLDALPAVDESHDLEFLRCALQSDRTLNSDAVSCACRLVRSVIAARKHDDVRARLGPGPFGAVEVVWETDRWLTWIVGIPKLSWPGVNVRCYDRPNPEDPRMRARSYHTAHGVVEHAIRVLGV